MDFLGAPLNSEQVILTLKEPNTHFVLNSPPPVKNLTSSKVVKLFVEIEEQIGVEDFQKLFMQPSQIETLSLQTIRT